MKTITGFLLLNLPSHLQVNGPKERRDRRKVRQLATVTEATPLTQALGHLLQVRLACSLLWQCCRKLCPCRMVPLLSGGPSSHTRSC
jgi:hypothetical protein